MRKAHRHRTLNCQPLEMRRLLAGDMTANCMAAPADPVVETTSAVVDPPETQNRGRIADEVSDSIGAHKRPGRGWDASGEAASAMAQPIAVDMAIAAEDIDPPETQNRGRIADEVDDSIGAHERPGRGWDASGDQAASAILSPVAVDVAIAADDIDPPETKSRGRNADEVSDSDGAHQRPGRGWD